MKNLEEHNLRQVFEQIAKLCEKTDPYIDVGYLWEWTKFDGTNEHHNTSLVIHEPSGVPVEGRPGLLGEQTVKGNYLLFDYIGHLPECRVAQCGDLGELIEQIMSEGGILNPFTTTQVPVINGIAKDITFVLEYKDKISFDTVLDKETTDKIRGEIVKICES
ncbi:MAG: hypothetical protein FWG66_14560 [Spirochaetes bacterium]|nr:hypothetical protein [Spirochaetota bacterium]